jgi:protein disulfide-isomerase A6
MVHTNVLAVAATALLAALPVQAGLYSKNSPVIQVDSRSYDRLIAQSNYTSVQPSAVS